jgi:hypothetical protein
MPQKLVEFEKRSNGLYITLLPAGREELADLVEKGGVEALCPESVLHDLLEHQLCNGWEIIAPEEVGALTDGLLLSDDVQRDDDGTLTHVGDVYWNSNYQIRAAAADLFEDGHVNFTRGG